MALRTVRSATAALLSRELWSEPEARVGSPQSLCLVPAGGIGGPL